MRTPFEAFRFLSLLFLFLVSISSPAVKSLNFFSLTSSAPGSIQVADTNVNTTGVVHFGAYGYCILTPLDGDTTLYCSSGRVGHTFDSTVQSALGVSNIRDIYAVSSSKAMVLNPLACAFVFLSMIANDNRISTPLFVTATFLFDIISVSIMRTEVKAVSGSVVDISLGPCTWLTMCAFIFIWIFYITFHAYMNATIVLKLVGKELSKESAKAEDITETKVTKDDVGLV